MTTSSAFFAKIAITALLLAKHVPVSCAQQSVQCPGLPTGDYCDCSGDCTAGFGFCECADAQACCEQNGHGGNSSDPLLPCLDSFAERLGVTALPTTGGPHLGIYRAYFCQYTKIDTSEGPIEIFGQEQLSSLQLYRARSILSFYLEDIDCDGCIGKLGIAIFDSTS